VRGGAKREPKRRIAAEITRKMRVTPRPRRRLVRSEMAPMMVGEKVSPKAWMQKRLKEMAVARTGAETELTMAALSGPVLRKRKNSVTKRAGMAQVFGPKKTMIPQGRVRATDQKESR